MENVLGLPVVFRFEFLAPACWCYPTYVIAFYAELLYPARLLHSLPPLLMEHFLLVHPGFVLF